ncbi:MAG: hypothetical protein KA035_04185 [Candidatus Levybacteria bacterium]|nr:hypothetical protein [Candidatus Levybacteria bacterium]
MNEVNNTPPVSSELPNNSGYFEKSQSEFKAVNTQRFKRFWEVFQYRARQVWPWVQRLINFVVYEIIKVLKAIVRIALSQIGLMKE